MAGRDLYLSIGRGLNDQRICLGVRNAHRERDYVPVAIIVVFVMRAAAPVIALQEPIASPNLVSGCCC